MLHCCMRVAKVPPHKVPQDAPVLGLLVGPKTGSGAHLHGWDHHCCMHK